MGKEEIWQAIRQQRLDLADFLGHLDDDAWDTPSLCEGWRVREVAAHVTLAARARPMQTLGGVVRAGGNVNRYIRADALRRAVVPPADLIAELRAVADVRHHPPGTKVVDPLVDVLVHGQDIAVPLGVTRAMPADAATAAADRVWGMGFPFFARRRFRGKRLKATNAPWERGDARSVEAPIEAPIETILLILTGRPVEA